MRRWRTPLSDVTISAVALCRCSADLSASASASASAWFSHRLVSAAIAARLSAAASASAWANAARSSVMASEVASASALRCAATARASRALAALNASCSFASRAAAASAAAAAASVADAASRSACARRCRSCWRCPSKLSFAARTADSKPCSWACSRAWVPLRSASSALICALSPSTRLQAWSRSRFMEACSASSLLQRRSTCEVQGGCASGCVALRGTARQWLAVLSVTTGQPN